MSAYSQNLKEIISHLGTDPQKGLTSQQAAQLFKTHGENKLRGKKKKNNLQRFVDQFKDVMILILIGAAVISFVIACIEGEPKEFFEPALILVIVLINAIMGVVQESKAEKALDALQNLSAPHARVLRDGKETVIEASHLVPGDIIRLEAGDFVPADARLLHSVSLKSEESALTGESVPSEKDAELPVKEEPHWETGATCCFQAVASHMELLLPWLPLPVWTQKWAVLQTCWKAKRRYRPPFKKSLLNWVSIWES